jgi:hypothetical protein
MSHMSNMKRSLIVIPVLVATWFAANLIGCHQAQIVKPPEPCIINPPPPVPDLAMQYAQDSANRPPTPAELESIADWTYVLSVYSKVAWEHCGPGGSNYKATPNSGAPLPEGMANGVR